MILDNTVYYSSYRQPNQPASTTTEAITTTATEEPKTTTEEANENYGKISTLHQISPCNFKIFNTIAK